MGGRGIPVRAGEPVPRRRPDLAELTGRDLQHRRQLDERPASRDAGCRKFRRHERGAAGPRFLLCRRLLRQRYKPDILTTAAAGRRQIRLLNRPAPRGIMLLQVFYLPTLGNRDSPGIRLRLRATSTAPAISHPLRSFPRSQNAAPPIRHRTPSHPPPAGRCRR